MSSQKQKLFQQKSALRFGKLTDYIAEKQVDGFPIKGNIWIAEYIEHYLEFLFKEYVKKHVLNKDEKRAIYSSNSSLKEFLVRAELGTTWLQEYSVGVSFVGLDQKEITKATKDLEKSIIEEECFGELKKRILSAKKGYFDSIPEIRLMDVGPAIGAISTIFALQTLDNYGLADKTQIHLVDVSDQVLSRNKKLDFPNPPLDFIKKYFRSEEYFNRLKKYLTISQTLQNCADEQIELADNYIDISNIGFFLHHVAREGKPKSGEEITRVTRGAIFVADEYFEDYEEFAEQHKHDKVPLAPEEPIPFLDSIVDIFPNTVLKEGTNIETKYYAYWLLKNSPIYYPK